MRLVGRYAVPGFLLLVWLLHGTIASAAPREMVSVRVVTVWHGELEIVPAVVSLEFEPALETAEVLQRQALSVRVPGEASLALPLESTWRLRAQVPDVWVRETVLAVHNEAPLWRVDLFPTGTLQGRLVQQSDIGSVRELTVRFQSPPEKPSFDPATTVCPVAENGAWRCEMPIGVYDVRLGSRGFAPAYFWGVSLAAGSDPQELGEISLIPGASLVGFVVFDPEPEKSLAVTLELRPASVRQTSSIPDAERMTRQNRVAVADSRGHFQFKDLTPGEYFVTASAPGYARRTTGPVSVFQPVETELQEALLLRPPARLQVAVNPPLAPSGDPWRLSLRPVPTSGRDLSSVVRGYVESDGSWVVDGVPEGEYYLDVFSSRTHWLTETVDVRAGAPLREVDVPVVQVEGELNWKGERRLVSLWFVEVGTRKRSRFTLDEDEFEGYLPYEGPWQVLLFDSQTRNRHVLDPVEVEVSSASGVARVSIDVPAGEIRGRVLDTQGDGVEGVEVQLLPQLERREASTTITGSGGAFIFALLAAGDYVVAVDTDDHALVSETVALQDALEPPEVILRLEEEDSLRVRVSVAGVPLPGAQVLATPIPLGHLMRAPNGVTGVQGDLELRFPRRSTHLEAIVFPPGYAVRVLRLEAGAEEVEVAVQRLGGTLTLQWTPEPHQSATLAHKPTLVKDGMAFSLMNFLPWARDRGVWDPEQGQVSIPMLESGRYTVCAPESSDGVSLAKAGATDAQSGCQSVFVPPSGEVLLTLP